VVTFLLANFGLCSHSMDVRSTPTWKQSRGACTHNSIPLSQRYVIAKHYYYYYYYYYSEECQSLFILARYALDQADGHVCGVQVVGLSEHIYSCQELADKMSCSVSRGGGGHCNKTLVAGEH